MKQAPSSRTSGCKEISHPKSISLGITSEEKTPVKRRLPAGPCMSHSQHV